jgi:hypothetical protein
VSLDHNNRIESAKRAADIKKIPCHSLKASKAGGTRKPAASTDQQPKMA